MYAVRSGIANAFPPHNGSDKITFCTLNDARSYKQLHEGMGQ